MTYPEMTKTGVVLKVDFIHVGNVFSILGPMICLFTKLSYSTSWSVYQLVVEKTLFEKYIIYVKLDYLISHPFSV